MAPTVRSMLLSYIKQGKPVFTCNAGKIAYVVHAYALISGCTFIGQRAEDAARHKEQELQKGWDLGDLVHFLYRTPGRAVLEVKVLPMSDRVVMHWGLQAAGSDGHCVNIRADDFVTKTMQGHKAFKEKHLGNLVKLIAPGLDTCIQLSEQHCVSGEHHCADAEGLFECSLGWHWSTSTSGARQAEGTPAALSERDSASTAKPSLGCTPAAGEDDWYFRPTKAWQDP